MLHLYLKFEEIIHTVSQHRDTGLGVKGICHESLLLVNPLAHSIFWPLKATSAGEKCPQRLMTTLSPSPEKPATTFCSPKICLGFVVRIVKIYKLYLFQMVLNIYFKIHISFPSKIVQKSLMVK